MKLRWWIFALPLLAFGVLALFLGRGLSLNPREVPSPLIGKPAPAFNLPRLDDPSKTLGLDDLKGKVWVLNVWASWCVPCREEHPLLMDLAARRLVPIVGLNYKDKRDAATQFLTRLGNPYQMTLVDADGRVGIDWGVYGVPETFVIDGAGTVRFKHIGPLNPEVVATKLLPKLEELQREKT
jgi:cytochrome c biogenesis protein CcmG, thiol:disulfide interchange protein DsbE